MRVGTNGSECKRDMYELFLPDDHFTDTFTVY
jgi:hypothetical protein